MTATVPAETMIGGLLPVLFAAAAALSPAVGVGARTLRIPRTTRVAMASVGELEEQGSGTQAGAGLWDLPAGDAAARLRALLSHNNGADPHLHCMCNGGSEWSSCM